MVKYQSMDIRTGYELGEIVELTESELVSKPFNVFFRKIDVINEKELLNQKKVEEELRQFKIELSDKGLSNKRVEKVIAKYSNKKELVEHIKHLDFDELTNDFLKKEYGEGQPSHKSASSKSSKIKGEN